MEISIVIPVYNVEKYLSRCLDSILDQSYTDYELLLIDDGSTDSSGKICKQYAEQHANITMVHKKNEGLGFARNSGLKLVQGKYVMFVDSDDYLEPDMLSNLWHGLQKDRADTCIGGYKKVTKAGMIKIKENPMAGTLLDGRDEIISVKTKMMGALPDGSDYIAMSACHTLYSNRIIREHQLRFRSEREYISEDLLFNLQYFSYAQRVWMSCDTGYCYCDNEGTLTTRYNPERFQMIKKLYLKLCSLSREIGGYDSRELRLMNTFLSNTRYCIKLEVKFSRRNGFRTMLRNIRIICNDAVLIDVLNRYDNSRTPIPSKWVNCLIKLKFYAGLICAERINLISGKR